MSEEIDDRPEVDEWRTYDEFAAGIDTYRLPNVSLDGQNVELNLDDGSTIELSFGADTVTWQASGAIGAAAGTQDPYDAVAVRDDVFFVNLPLERREGEAVTPDTAATQSNVPQSAIELLDAAIEGATPATPRAPSPGQPLTQSIVCVVSCRVVCRVVSCCVRAEVVRGWEYAGVSVEPMVPCTSCLKGAT